MTTIVLCSATGPREWVAVPGDEPPWTYSKRRLSPLIDLCEVDPVGHVLAPLDVYKPIDFLGSRKDDPVRPTKIVDGILYKFTEYHLDGDCTCISDPDSDCPCSLTDWRDIPTNNPVKCKVCREPAESHRRPPVALCYHCKLDWLREEQEENRARGMAIIRKFERGRRFGFTGDWESDPDEVQ